MPRYGFGRAPTPAELAAWDIDVRPDGHGVKKGRGTVQQGQVIYDAQCASCHGTFGESNTYMVIAGGVEPDDAKTGRAARLRDATAVRTVGNKLNHASTLWDYINRAMPWTHPQSLTVDEVYAVTAYVLNLNAIVPEDFDARRAEPSDAADAQPQRPDAGARHGRAVGQAGRPGKPVHEGLRA